MTRIQSRKGDHVCTTDSLRIEVLDISLGKVVLAIQDVSSRGAAHLLAGGLADVCRNRRGHFWFSQAGIAAFVMTCKPGAEVRLVGDGSLTIEQIANGICTIAFRDAAAHRLGHATGTARREPVDRPMSVARSGATLRDTRWKPVAPSCWARLAATAATFFTRQ